MNRTRSSRCFHIIAINALFMVRNGEAEANVVRMGVIQPAGNSSLVISDHSMQGEDEDENKEGKKHRESSMERCAGDDLPQSPLKTKAKGFGRRSEERTRERLSF